MAEEVNSNNNPNPTTSTTPAPSATPAPAAPDKQKQMVLGILAYIGILVVIPYLMGKDDSFVKFHTKQGVVLFVIEIALMVILSIMPLLGVLGMLVNLACLVFSIIGIINVVQGHEKELPVIGSFSKHVPL